MRIIGATATLRLEQAADRYVEFRHDLRLGDTFRAILSEKGVLSG
jgi:hypothetical protein